MTLLMESGKATKKESAFEQGLEVGLVGARFQRMKCDNVKGTSEPLPAGQHHRFTRDSGSWSHLPKVTQRKLCCTF